MDKLQKIIEKKFDIKRLMSEDVGHEIGGMVVCPFHMDTNPSAKFYADTDGITRLFCFACKKQFTSYHYLRDVRRVDLSSLLNSEEIENVEEIKEEKSKIDYSDLDCYKKDECNLKDFFKKLLEL